MSIGYDILVDSILGTGLRGPVRGFLRRVIASLAGFPGITVALALYATPLAGRG